MFTLMNIKYPIKPIAKSQRKYIISLIEQLKTVHMKICCSPLAQRTMFANRKQSEDSGSGVFDDSRNTSIWSWVKFHLSNTSDIAELKITQIVLIISHNFLLQSIWGTTKKK